MDATAPYAKSRCNRLTGRLRGICPYFPPQLSFSKTALAPGTVKIAVRRHLSSHEKCIPAARIGKNRTAPGKTGMPETKRERPLPASAFRIRRQPPSAILGWLGKGWQDLIHIGWPSYLHGIMVVVIGVILLSAALGAAHLLPGLATAFIIIGPILATGLYGLSRRRAQAQPTGLRDALWAWRTASRCLFRFSLLLLFAALAWVAVSALLFQLYVKVPIDDSIAFVRYVLTQKTLNFLLWSLLGSLGAAVVFASTVISVPLLLDRDVSTWDAILTSIRTVGENPLTMVLWALIIALATGLSLLTGMLGFIILYPLIGHASWHAYRDLATTDD